LTDIGFLVGFLWIWILNNNYYHIKSRTKINVIHQSTSDTKIPCCVLAGKSAITLFYFAEFTGEDSKLTIGVLNIMLPITFRALCRWGNRIPSVHTRC
jgi:hypothetical protein